MVTAMNLLEKIVRSATPSNGVQFRESAYGSKGVREFLRDVIAIANASVDGPRYIVVGADVAAGGQRKIVGVSKTDFSGKPAYASLVDEYVEPPINLRYHSVAVEGEKVGVYEIRGCHDRPYMMRVDFSETLRRGDAYMRLNESAMKMGRRQLQTLFETKFRDSVSAASIEIGFPGEIIHKDLAVHVTDMGRLPSAVAAAKLRQMLEIKNDLRSKGATSRMARLTHARLFGSDDPYRDRTSDSLLEDIREIERDYGTEDEYFRFGENGSELQLVVYNQGDEAVRDVSLTLVMPQHPSFHVASRLPPRMLDGRLSEQRSGDYPSVREGAHSIKVAVTLGDIDAGSCVNVFSTPLKLCVGRELTDKRLGIQYAVHAQNLRAPAKGKLRLLFKDSSEAPIQACGEP